MLLTFTFIIDPLWSETQSFSMFKEILQKSDNSNIQNIRNLTQIKTFKEFFELTNDMPLYIIIAHLTYGCYLTHKGLKKNTLIKLTIKVNKIQERSDLPVKYKSFRCTEEEIDKREYYLTNQLLHFTDLIDTN